MYPRRGEIWTANLGKSQEQHWVLVVSLDGRNLSDRIDSVLTVPFSGTPAEGPTIVKFEPGETGLPGTSYLRCHYINVHPKAALKGRVGRVLSNTQMREVCKAIRRAYDVDAPLN